MKYAIDYFRVEFLILLSYKMNFLLEYLNQIVAIVIKVQLWNAISINSNQKYDSGYYLNYFLFAFIIGQFTTFDLSISDKIKNGDLSLELVKPIDISVSEISKVLANKVVAVLKFLPLFALLVVCFSANLFLVKLNGWFFLYLAIGFLISFLIQFFINCIAFWFVDISAVKYIYSTVITVFSGALIPFEYMPDFIKKLFSFLPFQFFINAPIASVFESYTFEEKYFYLILGVIYIFLFFILNKIVFSAGIKKYTAVGG